MLYQGDNNVEEVGELFLRVNNLALQKLHNNLFVTTSKTIFHFRSVLGDRILKLLLYTTTDVPFSIIKLSRSSLYCVE